jgi:protein-tyrosine phosphatase
MTRVLFVCLGNICRSPTAEAACRSHVAQLGVAESIDVDSAGTGSWHVGESPDSRTQEAALRRGIDMSGQRARQVVTTVFFDFDYVLAMDRDNLASLEAMQPAGHNATVVLFMNYAKGSAEAEVPDPYYGGSNGFDAVLDMVENASQGLVHHILSEAGRVGSD